jgi:hypothetical protein
MQKKAIWAAALMAVLAIVLFFAFLNNSSVVKTTSSTSTIAINASMRTYAPAEEIGNVSAVYPNATTSMFSCDTSTDCMLVRTSSCFNNLASQQACINEASYNQYESYYHDYLGSRPTICPQYLIYANASCSCISNGCSLVYKTG